MKLDRPNLFTLAILSNVSAALLTGRLSDSDTSSGRSPWPWPGTSDPQPDLPGRYVSFQDLHRCPSLTPKDDTPSSAKDVRPDDIKVIMAIGDSITVGFLARPTSSSSSILSIKEWRGLSYPIGGDEGAITLPNILSRWSLTTGQSHSYIFDSRPKANTQHPLGVPPVPPSVSATSNWQDDLWTSYKGLNGAVSGSTSLSLYSQVRDYILPRLSKMNVSDTEWKFVNVGIGANDICAFCLAPNSTLPLVGSPEEFAEGIKDAVDLLRKHVPRLIVNIIGLFKVSSLYALTLKNPYCKSIFLPPALPHLPLECNCALLPGPVGDYTRRRMDDMSEAYDSAVLQVIKDWQQESDREFGVMWQPGSFIDLESWPIEALSPIDCFHPSEAAHQRVAAGLWNRLTMGLETKSRPIRWTEEVSVRCLEDDDRFGLGI
ncbi:hypothetical protein BD324DRAFT_112149 [Kockovaella imperatae]|uniref:SGNH hydrolase-type esterase domain-containing protein n=1 Tax=Kockovaella imperatae TaxID=4999 RepID=A0A1Y1UAF0_9TREE|nr:hypothetical protein BD324DRAFT_112149 [Kockovaella imperatae]ORX35013.1 hypothetical protein BD324DRAFT_112149 [Kockovaella imperatae]